MDAIDALTSVEWSLDGGATLFSLADAGYARVGIDEGWEACGAGVNGTQHDADGAPVIDTVKFPDMGALVAYGHSKNIEMGGQLKDASNSSGALSGFTMTIESRSVFSSRGLGAEPQCSSMNQPGQGFLTQDFSRSLPPRSLQLGLPPTVEARHHQQSVGRT